MVDYFFECNIENCPHDYICQSDDFKSSDCEYYMNCKECYYNYNCPLEFFHEECERYKGV